MSRTVRRIAMYGRATETKKYKALFYAVTLLMLPLALPMEIIKILGDTLDVPLNWLMCLRSKALAKIFILAKWPGAKVIEYEVDDEEGGKW